MNWLPAGRWRIAVVTTNNVFHSSAGGSIWDGRKMTSSLLRMVAMKTVILALATR